jgi:hypothetical protein
MTSDINRIYRAGVTDDGANKPKGRQSYDTPHDKAIKAANWAMKENPKCVEAHQAWMAAKEDLETAVKNEVPAARKAAEAAKAKWLKVTNEVFNRVMAEAGFPQADA